MINNYKLLILFFNLKRKTELSVLRSRRDYALISRLAKTVSKCWNYPWKGRKKGFDIVTMVGDIIFLRSVKERSLHRIVGLEGASSVVKRAAGPTRAVRSRLRHVEGFSCADSFSCCLFGRRYEWWSTLSATEMLPDGPGKAIL